MRESPMPSYPGSDDKLPSTRRSFMRLASGAAVLGALGGVSGAAQAQAQGSPLRIVVGFPPGGGADALARLIGEKLKGQHPTLVVDNRAGAGSRIALEHVSRAKGDGSTVIIAPDFALTIYPHIYKSQTYNVQNDFTPVALVATSGIALSVGPQVPASVRTLQEYVQWVKAQGNVANYGTAGAGSAMDLVGRLFGRAAGIEVNHIAYRGGAAALQDVLGGQLPAAITGVLEPLQHVSGGRLRVLATSGENRSRVYPDTPTFVESGYKNVSHLSWYGILAPSSTPAGTVQQLNAQINEALRIPSVVAAIQELGLDPIVSTPSDLAALTRTDSKKWEELVKAEKYFLEG